MKDAGNLEKPDYQLDLVYERDDKVCLYVSP